MIDQAAAERALIDLGAAMRGWDRQDLAQAIFAARQAGWDFTRICRYLTRLIDTEDGEPRNLRAAAANPFRPAGGTAPADGPAWAAVARDLLEHRNDPPGDAA